MPIEQNSMMFTVGLTMAEYEIYTGGCRPITFSLLARQVLQAFVVEATQMRTRGGWYPDEFLEEIIL